MVEIDPGAQDHGAPLGGATETMASGFPLSRE